jgi:hypothetical protein
VPFLNSFMDNFTSNLTTVNEPLRLKAALFSSVYFSKKYDNISTLVWQMMEHN